MTKEKALELAKKKGSIIMGFENDKDVVFYAIKGSYGVEKIRYITKFIKAVIKDNVQKVLSPASRNKTKNKEDREK